MALRKYTRPPFILHSHFTLSNGHPYMVQMHLEPISQYKHIIALNKIPKYVPDNDGF
jgi:hypothetical protein